MERSDRCNLFGSNDLQLDEVEFQSTSLQDTQQIIPSNLRGERNQYSHADSLFGVIPPPIFSHQYVSNDGNTGRPYQYSHADGFSYQYMPNNSASTSTSNLGDEASQSSYTDGFPGQPLFPYGPQYMPNGDNLGGEANQYLNADGYYGAISQAPPLAFGDFLQNTPAADDFGSELTQYISTGDLHGTVPPSLTYNPQDIHSGSNDGSQSSGDLIPSELEPPTSQISRSLAAPVNTDNVAPKSGNEVARKFEYVRAWSGNLIGQHERFRVGKSSHIKCLHAYKDWRRERGNCDKIFKTKRDFERHWNSVHERNWDLRCPIAGCGNSFSREDNLLNHRRVIHKEDIPKRKVRFGSGQPRKGSKPAKKDAEGSQQ